MSAQLLERQERLMRRVRNAPAFRRKGHVAQITGLAVEGSGPSSTLGELCWIQRPGRMPCAAEVVGFRDSRVILMPLGELEGVGPGQEISASGHPLSTPAGMGMLGRVIDGLGNPLDGKGPLRDVVERPLTNTPPDPLKRGRVTRTLPLGVRSVDSLLTCGMGQRLGIFGGSGVGKSTLMGMFARNTKADLNVIALIGERGREVRDFLEKDLGPEGLKRSVVIVVTSDQPALLKLKGALAAATISEYFRESGRNVLMMLDSVTRLCLAQREIGLAAGEPPATKGYPPSVFAMLPRFLERAGMGERGSVTGLYTVLVEGDDMNEPVADAVRGILDGHVVLSRELAAGNHFPAIDVMRSASRVFPDLASPVQRKAAGKIRQWMATYTRARDLLDVGAYVPGSNPEIDAALKVWPDIQAFLRQDPAENAAFEPALKRLAALAGEPWS